MKIKIDLIILLAIEIPLITLACIIGADGIYSWQHTTTITEEGTILSVEPHLNTENHIEYLTITFDNNHSYDIKAQNMDFTVHSKIILEIQKSKHIITFIPGLTGDYWYVNNLIKAPSSQT